MLINAGDVIDGALVNAIALTGRPVQADVPRLGRVNFTAQG
jgi:hypothetical protein